MRALDGLARGLDDRDGLGSNAQLGAGNDGGFRTEPGEHLVYVERGRAQSTEDPESWAEGDTAAEPGDDPLLPLGLDSHRYRCCGNGVVSSVAEWIGYRLASIAEAA